MFGSLLDTLDKWFGRTFLLARYLPCLLAVAINAMVVYAAFPDARSRMRAIVAAPLSDRLTVLAVVLIGTAIVAFAAAPFVRLAADLLRGDHLPDWLAQPMIEAEVRRHDENSERDRILFESRAALPEETDVKRRLADARERGSDHGRITSRALIERAGGIIDELQTLRRRGRPIDAGRLAHATAALVEALSQNCADTFSLKTNSTPEGHELSEKLAKLHTTFWKVVLPYARSRAETQEAREFEQRERLFSQTELKPTRLGNQVAALEAYCTTRYGIEFQYFWPRFLLVLLKDDKLSTAITSARVPFEFALVSFVLTLLSVAGWLTVLTCVDGRLEVTVGIIAAGPVVAWFWLRALKATHDEFADTVRAIIDIGRFRLLEELRLPLPETLANERPFWEDLARFAVAGSLDGPLQTRSLKHPIK